MTNPPKTTKTLLRLPAGLNNETTAKITAHTIPTPML